MGLRILEMNNLVDKAVDIGLPLSSISWHTRMISALPSTTTSLALGFINNNPCAVVGGIDEEAITLTFQHVASSERRVLTVPSVIGGTALHAEAIISIAIVPNISGRFLVLCGTRNGMIITLEITEIELDITSSRFDRIGATSVSVSRDECEESGSHFFVTCDSKVYSLTPAISSVCDLPKRWRGRHLIHQVWLTDALRPDFPQPKINSVVRVRPIVGGGRDGGLLLVSGSQLLLAGFSIQPRPVPRHMAIGGTATRMLYSQSLGVIIVAASVRGKSTLLFVDPETGQDLSQPVDHKTKLPIDFIFGLGNQKERVFRLFEWSYVKDGKTWNFIIVSTNTGKVLIVSTNNPDEVREAIHRTSRTTDGGSSAPKKKICYYTRHMFKAKPEEPVTAVTGFTDGLLWCAGDTLYCETLDAATKKFKGVAEYILPSFAVHLSFEDGVIYALTAAHSLEVLKLVSSDREQWQIIRTHGDQLSRDAIHHIMLRRFSDRPIHLICDKTSSLVGLWPTRDNKADTLVPIFEAQIPYSLIRSRFGRCRPV